MIHIVNLEVSNVASVANMLRRAGCPETSITNDPETLSHAKRIILPGVGSFDHAMQAMDRFGLREILFDRAMKAKVPLLGICLGMQMLFEGSEEGTQVGLRCLPGRSVRFRTEGFSSQKLRVPHMGWNTLSLRKKSKLFPRVTQEETEADRFYFVHSYHVQCDQPDDILATTDHGYAFSSAVERDNVFGVQFHPEKSHRYGMQLLKAFHELT